MKKPTPEDREEIRRLVEEGRAARENMQRILDEIDARRRERQVRAARPGLWRRIVGSRPA
jgi:hypothetical protein